MNLDELKMKWGQMHIEGLNAYDDQAIRAVIDRGTSEAVSNINRKLFNGMLVTGLAVVISALSVVAFYYVYDPSKHPWIDVSKLVPVQALAFVIFLLLFLFGWLEYRLVNRKTTSQPVQAYVSGIHKGFKKYQLLFTAFILTLLILTFYLELDYFMVEESANWLFTKIGLTAVLTTVSYLAMKYYYKVTFGTYIENLASYHDQLNE